MMTILRYTSLYLSFLLIVSCSLSDEDEIVRHSPLHGFKGNTIEVFKTITVSENEVFDGNGNMYDWRGEGDCSQQESMPPMFVLLQGSTLKNLWMKNAPDGIHVKGSNIIVDNIVNIDVCEDAISIKRGHQQKVAENVEIVNSRFYHCYDKAIQLTRGNNILIRNNEFYHCAKAIRIKEKANTIKFNYNKVFDAKVAAKVTGGMGMATSNYIEGSKVGFWAEKNGSFIDAGDNVFVDVKDKYKETENGKVTVEKSLAVTNRKKS